MDTLLFYKNKNYLISWLLGLSLTLSFIVLTDTMLNDWLKAFKAVLALTVLSLPGTSLSYSLFKNRFHKKASLMRHISRGLLSSLTLVLINYVVFITLLSISTLYQASDFPDSSFELTLVLIYIIVLASPGVLVSGCLLGWLNFKATSSHQ